jgi:DNA polymerase (family 10)
VADKFEVARALREIALLLEVDGANPFKVKAYERGARAVEVLREDVTELARANRLTEVPGIGANLAATITEIATTGKSQQLEKLKSRLPPGILELAPVLSLQKVKVLHEELGIATLDDLRTAAEAGRLRAVKGFGAKTEQKILDAIRRVGERVEETLLYEATREGEGALEHLRASPAVEAAEIAGALRRRCETVTRIDVVIAAKEPEAALEHALAFPLITNVVERGDRVGSGRLAAGVALAVEAVRVQPHRDIQTVTGRRPMMDPSAVSPTQPGWHHHYPEPHGSSALLINALKKWNYPPVALPAKEYMESARRLWDELGLPQLKPKSPWHGYELGHWPEELRNAAEAAAAGREPEEATK